MQWDTMAKPKPDPAQAADKKRARQRKFREANRAKLQLYARTHRMALKTANSVATEDLNSVATEDLNSVATEDLNSVATEDLNSVATEDGLNSVATEDLNSVATEDLNSVATEDGLNSVATDDLNSVATEEEAKSVATEPDEYMMAFYALLQRDNLHHEVYGDRHPLSNVPDAGSHSVSWVIPAFRPTQTVALTPPLQWLNADQLHKCQQEWRARFERPQAVLEHPLRFVDLPCS